jgi:hypothetical protein
MGPDSVFFLHRGVEALPIVAFFVRADLEIHIIGELLRIVSPQPPVAVVETVAEFAGGAVGCPICQSTLPFRGGVQLSSPSDLTALAAAVIPSSR